MVTLLMVPGLRMGGAHPSACSVWAGVLQGLSGCPTAPSHISLTRGSFLLDLVSHRVWAGSPIIQGVGLIGGLPHQTQISPSPASTSSLVLHICRKYSLCCWAPAEPTLVWIKCPYLTSSSPPGLCPKLGPRPPSLAVWAFTCQVCFSRDGGEPGAMKPVPFVTLWWVLLLVSGLGATRKGSPEEASFYYGTFPPGMSIPLLICLSVWLACPPWLACQRVWCFSFLTSRMWKITPCSVLK